MIAEYFKDILESIGLNEYNSDMTPYMKVLITECVWFDAKIGCFCSQRYSWFVLCGYFKIISAMLMTL